MFSTRVLVVVLIAGALLGIPLPVAAQGAQAPADSPRFQTDIVVTPERGETERNRVPAATVVIEGAALPALPAVQLGEISSFLPGFHLQQAQPYSVAPLVSARGFFGGGEAEYVLLLVDGVPTMDAESGLIDWSAVPASSIRRIEAFRGPGASLYGDSAIGGVIQVLTSRPASGGTLTLSGGSFSTFVADGSYGHRTNAIGVMVTGAATRTDGTFTHADARRFVLSGALDGRIRQAPWRWTINGTSRDQDDPGPIAGGVLARDPFVSHPLFRFDTLNRDGFATAFNVDATAADWQYRVRAHAATRDDDRVRTILLAPELGDRRARALSTMVVGGTVESERTFSGSIRSASLRFGADVSDENVDTTYRAVSDTGTIGPTAGESAGGRVRGGAYASSAWEPVSRLRLAAGARWDRIRDDFNVRGGGPHHHQAWSPRVGATVLLDEGGTTTAFVQASRAFKVPTLDQLFDARPFPDFRGGTFTISNPRLLPQRATNLEAGVSGGSLFRWRVLGYYMTVDNEIDFDVRSFTYANIGESRHRGIELESSTIIAGPIQPSITYAFVGVTRPDDDRQLKNVPRHVVTASADIRLPWDVGAHIRYKHTAGAFLDDDNAYRIDGPSTLDLRIRRPLRRQTLFVDLINLTDNRYDEYGFTLADFRGRIVPYAYPGAPRAVRAGVIASF